MMGKLDRRQGTNEVYNGMDSDRVRLTHDGLSAGYSTSTLQDQGIYEYEIGIMRHKLMPSISLVSKPY